MLVCLKLEIAIVPHAQNCVTEDAESYSSDSIGLETVRITPISDAAARLKNGLCGTMTLPREAARCRAVLWGGELDFGGEGFGEFWGDAFDGEEVVDGGEGFCLSGLYDAFGEFGAHARE